MRRVLEVKMKEEDQLYRDSPVASFADGARDGWKFSIRFIAVLLVLWLIWTVFSMFI